ncbi:restriction endonuclease subunit M [Streptomyces sp. NBC_00588]|uniref:restriction endonuclease subunit M n=1 Tax=Streptomyces sp. NBC_00588 TaxID=2975784 RepID=UPI002E81517A|nr:N-6 DNA methylase [Streptomyces sp. NBC_00588]WUB38542.1 N-6 DNA methylase [Streptomyces sp. NBC_00588]
MEIRSEEDVKIHYLPHVLRTAGYDTDLVGYNVPIQVQQGRKVRTIFADAVVYADKSRTRPLVVVETKPPEPLKKGDADQAISYARLLDQIAPVVLLTNGTPSGTIAYDAFTKKKLTDGLPSPGSLSPGGARSQKAHSGLAAEARHELFKVDDVREFKRILRACHNAIRNNEGYDPTKAFDELSKVMFTKLYEEKAGKNRFRLRTYDEFLDSNMNVVHQIFRETAKSNEYKGLFVDGEAIELSDRTIRELVSQLEGYDLSLTNFDVKGEAFEHFLGDTFTGGLGQYFTPRNVVEFIVQALGPRAGQKAIDPFCGTGGFLIKWHEVVEDAINEMPISDDLRKQYLDTLNRESLYGIDWNERTSLACRMNMTVHGEGQSAENIFKQSGYADVPGKVEEGAFDVCITNPPFGASESDPTILKAHEIGQGRKSIERAALALERALRLVKPGGWVGIIVMDGILSNASTRFVRDYVRKHAHVRALISLTPETFEAYGGRSDTTILLLEKKAQPSESPEPEPTFMAVCRNTGYAPNGAEIPGNELPAILEAYQGWRKGQEPTTPNTWTAVVKDRLDPRNYWRPEAQLGDRDDLDKGLRGLLDDIGETARLVQQISEEIDAVMAGTPATVHKLGDLLTEVVENEVLDDDTEYPLLGVRWWGGGAFVREHKKGVDIKSRTHRVIRAGNIVYNRLFAYRASFAIVGPECDGVYASNEFPTYDAKETAHDPALLKRYIVHALNSPVYLPVVDAESSGSTKTSRNRFRQQAFEAFEVAVPDDPADLEKLVRLFDQADRVRERLAALAESSKDLRTLLAPIIAQP